MNIRMDLLGLIVIAGIIGFWGDYWNTDKKVIHLIGDSTMATRMESVEINPERGWGQALSSYFNDHVEVRNHAKNGRSTKSFIDEGLWQDVLDQLEPGHFVFIQFGHNDQKINDPKRYTNPVTAYYNNIAKFVDETREKGATPILLTSIVRRKFNDHGTLIDTHGLYPLIVRQLALEKDVLFIDHLSRTEAIVQSLGPDQSKTLYNWIEPNTNKHFPQGEKDDTHLSERGAKKFAGIIVNEIEKSELLLKKYIKSTDG